MVELRRKIIYFLVIRLSMERLSETTRKIFETTELLAGAQAAVAAELKKEGYETCTEAEQAGILRGLLLEWGKVREGDLPVDNSKRFQVEIIAEMLTKLENQESAVT
jgi:hypothetical protein